MSQKRGLQIPKINEDKIASSTPKSTIPKNSKLNFSNATTVSQSLAEETFVKWQNFIEEQVGFVLPKNQTHWLWHAVNRLAEEEKTTQLDLLSKVIKDDSLKQKIIDAVLIPQSRFFRHKPSMTFIGDYAKTINNEIDTNRHDHNSSQQENQINVWSVGCSYGQEAWSIAMVLSDLQVPYQVWGADVNQSALKSAEQAIYSSKQLNEIPLEYKKFTVIQNENEWLVAKPLRQRTHFFKYNLFSQHLPDVPYMDIITCQNVLIYFRQFDQRDILSRLIKKLKIGGYLLLSPGEASQWHHPLMQKLPNLQVNVWKKIKQE